MIDDSFAIEMFNKSKIVDIPLHSLECGGDEVVAYKGRMAKLVRANKNKRGDQNKVYTWDSGSWSLAGQSFLFDAAHKLMRTLVGFKED